MTYRFETAREQQLDAVDVIWQSFSKDMIKGHMSAQYTIAGKLAVGVCGLLYPCPAIQAICQHDVLQKLMTEQIQDEAHVLFVYEDEKICAYRSKDAAVFELDLTSPEVNAVRSIVKASFAWGGQLDADGALTCECDAPAPGPHYFTNLLIGNRIGFDRPLQSTPKSVVDRLGRGSFRSHADTQVLATRWDYLPEENGFPANRQFYLIENGKQIFYSGLARQPSVVRAYCRHLQNRTQITYELGCGLHITRTIFILPQREGLPLATEAQVIDILNKGEKTRDLRIVYTGMFGTNETHALREDVIFTTVVAQSEIIYGPKGDIRGMSFNPNPKWTKGNIRFCTMMVHKDNTCRFPDQFCARYSDFVGNGTLDNPQNVGVLSNKHSRKGPGFFALSTPVCIEPKNRARAEHLTCLSSDVVNPCYKENVTVHEELDALISRYKQKDALQRELDEVVVFAQEYASCLSITHEDKDYAAYINANLPFQVFYQTFVSRSFDQTQKGYREIGFREIQDIFASMYYFAGMGNTDFIKKLLREWAGNVTEDGYANHNFFWTGKEPGWWSDDALWLLQALDRYIGLTGDFAFLKEALPVAGTDDMKRQLTDTILAILRYSSNISIGGHGLPLIDRADWNDCLRMDPDCVSGPKKIMRYKEQLEKSGGTYGETAFVSEYSESVMNGFLLKVAMDAAAGLFRGLAETNIAETIEMKAKQLFENLLKSAWKEDFYARVLFNRKDKPHLSYLGAKGDKLAVEPGAKGTYFLNTFSWSLLADCATEQQIAVMLDTIDQNLRTPYGYRLCSTVDYPKIAPKIDVALYYPGDRENGGIFKHANMMAASAMLKAAKTAKNRELAQRLAETAYWIIDCILPYKALQRPYDICGNPRWCTQYNNSQTGENIGPTLSGTSTWLLLSLLSGMGITFTSQALVLDPILRADEDKLDYIVHTGRARYHVVVIKQKPFARVKDGAKIVCDNKQLDNHYIPIFTDDATHEVKIHLA